SLEKLSHIFRMKGIPTNNICVFPSICSNDEKKRGRHEKKDQNFIKKENQNLILDLIQDHDLVTRAKLARLASMSPTTVSRIVASLMDVGLVKETNKHTTGVGRKAT